MSSSQNDATVTIGLMAAMASESRALLQLIKGGERFSLGHFPTYRFSATSQNCILVTSGMGILRADQAARYLVEKYQPGILISFGIAGTVEPDLEIGDVVAAGSCCLQNGNGFIPCPPLIALPALAHQAASQALSERNARLFSGTAITTTPGIQLPSRGMEAFLHPILEMETAGIARIATEKHIPLLSLRAISDNPRHPLPIDLAEVMDEHANLLPGRLIKAILRHPRMLLTSGPMLRNSRIAADNAAIALLATLNSGGLRGLTLGNRS